MTGSEEGDSDSGNERIFLHMHFQAVAEQSNFYMIFTMFSPLTTAHSAIFILFPVGNCKFSNST